MIVGAKAGSEERARASPRSRPESGLEELGIEEPDVLETSLPCSIAPLLCAMLPLGAKSLSGLLGTAELCKGFFQQVVILEQSEKTLSYFKRTSYTIRCRTFKIVIKKNQPS